MMKSFAEMEDEVTVRVCVAIRESTAAEAAAAAARAAEWADLVEVRADYLDEPDLELLFRSKRRPTIFTMRSPAEGGRWRGSEARRIETILKAAQAGADYVDVEFSAAWEKVLAEVPAGRVILSHHDFERTPGGLDFLLDEMAATGAGVLKIAVRAQSLGDNLRIAALLEHAAAKKARLIALAMGRPGMPSRILGPAWGSWATFASLPGGAPTADGQVPADELIDGYRIRELTRETALFGIVGKPVGHSLSPALHNAAFAASGRDAVYLPLEADGFEDFLRFAGGFPVRGASVTIPYKREAFRTAAALTPEAEQTGAVNTLVRNQKEWRGGNSDVDGFLGPLRKRFRTGPERAVVLGAGGAARAAVYGLRRLGAAVCVVARNREAARTMAESFHTEYRGWDQLSYLKWDLLVNATPVGMYPEVGRSPVPAGILSGGWVYDLVYNPPETLLLETARRRGCKTIAGTEMFLEQALRQQIFWFGAPAPERPMAEALERALKERGV